MSNAALRAEPPVSAPAADPLAPDNERLLGLSAEERVAWALERLPGLHVLSSSFGIQAAVSLHLVTRLRPDIPVLLVDTGYLFPETYRFVETLRQRLQLNLRVCRPAFSPGAFEARYGRLWEDGVEGIEHYNAVMKVAPMQAELDALGVGTWISGLRRDQAQSRADLPVVEFRKGRYKVHPLLDWTNRDIHRYLKEHDLPYHPLWEQGYVSVGDVHTTRPLAPGMSEQDTRFFGLKRECGLHE